MKWILAAALAALVATTALKASESDASVQRLVAEGNGTLTIETDGTVSAVTLPDELDPALREAYAGAIRRWTFEPVIVDGRTVRALGHMNLAFAIEVKEGKFHSASIERVTFTDPPSDKGPARILVSEGQMVPPRYPRDLAVQGIGGEVMLAVETDADGRVLRAAPQSGRLYVRLRRSEQARAQRAFGLLADSSVRAAMHWTLPGCRSAICTMPVRFTMQMSEAGRAFWFPAHAVSVTPEAWMLGAGAVALGADGAAPSTRFQLKSKIDGFDVLRAGG